MWGDVDSSAPTINRSNLEMAFADALFERDAYRLAHEVAQPTLVARTTDTKVNSRVGGCGALPPGQGWPVDRLGVPLSFVAVIDLVEVQATLPVAALPVDGWLLVFARLETEEYIDPDDANVQILRCTEEPVPTEPPESDGPGPDTVRASNVIWEPHLTLPHGEDVGIDASDLDDYRDVLAVMDDTSPHSFPLIYVGGFPPDAEDNRGLAGHAHVVGIATDLDEVLELPQQSTTHFYAPSDLTNEWSSSDLITTRLG